MTISSPINMDTYATLGFLKIPGLIEPALLRKLHDLFHELMHTSTPDQDMVVLNNGTQNYIINIDKLCHRGNLACLELFGLPALTDIARQFCGADFFSLQEFAVIKNRGDESQVLWHQDLIYPLDKGSCINIGIYLDEVGNHDGALRVVPGSHRSDLDICTLKNEPSQEIPMQAGDVLVHDMRLAHSSQALREKELRRVIYFEFMPAALMLEMGLCNEQEIQTRRQLAELAATYYKQQHTAETIDADALRKQIEQIYQIPIRHFPSAYCLDLPGSSL